MNNNIKGTSADRPSKAHLFDFVKCAECVLYDKCRTKDLLTGYGCRFGVGGKGDTE